ncbi:MAG: hypothetical protein ACR2HG_08300 [Pyrinomonadaceae bacterium]
MQDVQNIPNPDVNSTERDDDFGSHSSNQDVERPEEDIPVPPDREPSAPIEEPPVETGETEPKRIA